MHISLTHRLGSRQKVPKAVRPLAAQTQTPPLKWKGGQAQFQTGEPKRILPLALLFYLRNLAFEKTRHEEIQEKNPQTAERQNKHQNYTQI